MRKTVLVYGSISAILTSGLMLMSLYLMEKKIINFDNGALFGYGGMIIALSMVFFGMKSYRDNNQNGVIKFWRAVQIGSLITLIASLAYATTWEGYYRLSSGAAAEHMQKYGEAVVNKMKQSGASQEEIDKKTKQMADLNEIYKNPFIRFGMTLAEILPVGIIIVFISAGILRKKEILPA